MPEPYVVSIDSEGSKDSLALVERMDPAIGEATTVVGAMLTELLRRTLRGGVIRIGDEMHGYVNQKVDVVIAEKTPVLEHIAADVAEHTARTAATEVATEEVRSLEARTQESDRQLAAQAAEDVRALEARAAEEVRALEMRTQENDRQLAEQAAAKVRDLEERAQEGDRQLAAQIEATEKRAQAALQGQVQALVDRARERSERLKSKFTDLEAADARLAKQHDGLLAKIQDLLQANQALVTRIVELEKPRGLRAFFLRLFGRRKPKPAATAEEQDLAPAGKAE